MIVHKLLPLVALGLNLLLLGSALAPDRRSLRNVRFAYLATALAVWNLGVFGLRASADPDVALFWGRVLHVALIPIPVLFYHSGIPGNAIFALALGVAIVRYRLMDIGVLAKRIVLYLLTSVALAPILFLGLWALDQFVDRPATALTPDGFGVDTLTRDAAILLLVFTVALPVLRKLEGGLERLMFRRRHGVRDALVKLMRELGSLLEVSALGRTLTEGLVTRIPVLGASLYRYDRTAGRFTRLAHATSEAADAPSARPGLDKALALWLGMTGRTLIVEEASFQGDASRWMRPGVTQLERERIALVVPLFMEGEVAGVLVVGEKLSGEIFDGDEIELLEMLAGETVITLKNAGLYQDLQSRMNELQRTQESLLESAKLAAIGELAASVAHEINNPLMVILGNSNLLLRHMPSDSPAFKKVTDIETETNRAGKIVRDLLDFARRREPKRERVSIHELLDRAIELLRPKLAGGSVEVERVFDLSLPPIAGDRDQLTQVFLNLITNALDAMERRGRVVLETSIHQEDDGRTMVTVSVADAGRGIPPAHRARIFEPFYTTKDEGRGTGLGLSVSLGIVQMHEGSIEVESKLGHGTTVRVTLPVWEAPGAP